MANLTGVLRSCPRQILAHHQKFFLHTSPVIQTHLMKNSKGKFPVTMIPGDGVGPELMDSVIEVSSSISHFVKFLNKH